MCLLSVKSLDSLYDLNVFFILTALQFLTDGIWSNLDTDQFQILKEKLHRSVETKLLFGDIIYQTRVW